MTLRGVAVPDAVAGEKTNRPPTFGQDASKQTVTWAGRPAFPGPRGQAALKTLYLVTRSLDPKGLGQARWKPALNAFAITFADRMPAAENV